MVDIYSMEVFKAMKNFGIIGIAFWGVQISWGVQQFRLPAGMTITYPQTQSTPNGKWQQPNHNGIRVDVEDVEIFRRFSLSFPSDGSQPDTQDAGVWSGAQHIGQPNDDAVTDWWIRAFGGDRAVALSSTPVRSVPAIDRASRMGFGVDGRATHIIRVDTTIAGTPPDFERQFWQDFRHIAEDPVGRVLLYRLLIEIRRTDGPNGPGCCGADVLLPAIFDISIRNNYRNITIRFDAKCAFSYNNVAIKFIHNDANETRTLTVGAGGLTTQRTSRTTDIGLFHEMLHWFHQLRNPRKMQDNKNKNSRGFSYATRCYYGDPATAMGRFQDAFTWRMKSTGISANKINGEEIATILGSPDLNTNPHPYVLVGVDLINANAFYPVPPHQMNVTIGGVPQHIPDMYKFFNGEDLSENVYRASKMQPMRWGHVSGVAIQPVPWPNPPNRFLLAHKIAFDCYHAITGNLPPGWLLIQGQAIR